MLLKISKKTKKILEPNFQFYLIQCRYFQRAYVFQHNLLHINIFGGFTKKPSDYLKIIFLNDFSTKINKSSLFPVFFNRHIKICANFSPFCHIHRLIIVSNSISHYLLELLIYYISYIIIDNCRILYEINNEKLKTKVIKGAYLWAIFLLPLTRLKWIHNYWDNWKSTLPKPIPSVGTIYIIFFFTGSVLDIPIAIYPSFQFDWRPAQEPYDIS